ncbi:MAG: sodium-dependent transporter [Candidatus Aminicenantes bacterium]|nr:sodium-dependent transporter [Candidatus Aminicenantes bacterium]
MIKRGNWNSRIGFILAASGSAVGLGNIWRFPYTAGKNGGAAFLVIYLAAILALALPVLLAEAALGRATGKNPVGAFKAIAPRGLWKSVGYLGVTAGFMILSYYAVIAGWTLGYFFKAVSGEFNRLTAAGHDAATMSRHGFASFTSSPVLQIILLAVFLGLTIYVTSRGVSGGIERWSKMLMPLLLGLLLLLMVRALTLKGAGAGVAFYLKPDFSLITPSVVIAAMGQAFFSLSLGIGTMITYGSYVKKNENLPASTGWIALCDTLIAVTAGFIIFPAVFSQGMDPAEGPGLVFNILPVIFAKIPMGQVFGAFFFLLLAIAALTTTVSLLEVPVAYFIDERGWPRRRAAWIAGGICLVFGIPAALSQGSVGFLTRLPLVNTDFLSFWDLIWGNLVLSIGALLIAVFVGWIWKSGNALLEITRGSGRFRPAFLWVIAIRYLAPVLILVILLSKILS